MTYNKEDFDLEKYKKAMDIYIKNLFGGKDIPEKKGAEDKEKAIIDKAK